MLKWLLVPDITKNKSYVGAHHNVDSIERKEKRSLFMGVAKFVSKDLQMKDVKVGMVVNPGSHHVVPGLYYHATQKLQRYTVLDYNHMILQQGTNAPFHKLPILFYFTSTLHEIDEKLLRECVKRSERCFVLYGRWPTAMESGLLSFHDIKLQYGLADIFDFLVNENDGTVCHEQSNIGMENLRIVFESLKSSCYQHLAERGCIVAPGSTSM